MEVERFLFAGPTKVSRTSASGKENGTTISLTNTREEKIAWGKRRPRRSEESGLLLTAAKRRAKGLLAKKLSVWTAPQGEKQANLILEEDQRETRKTRRWTLDANKGHCLEEEEKGKNRKTGQYLFLMRRQTRREKTGTVLPGERPYCLKPGKKWREFVRELPSRTITTSREEKRKDKRKPLGTPLRKTRVSARSSPGSSDGFYFRRGRERWARKECSKLHTQHRLARFGLHRNRNRAGGRGKGG